MSTQKNNQITKIQISLATQKNIRDWSSGAVLKPETINYKTYKPERDGLFDERIFGPTKDFVCSSCGKKHKRADVGRDCTSCGESIIYSKLVRRRMMGHIELAAPVAHIWFSKVDYSVIKSILGLKQDELDSLLYFKSHVVLNVGKFDKIKKNLIINIQKAPSQYRRILGAIKDETTDKATRKRINEKIKELVSEAKSEIGKDYGIDFYDYNNFIKDVSKGEVEISTGAESVRYLLDKISLKREITKIKKTLIAKPSDTTLFRRLKVIESIVNSGTNPTDMILDVIPVIPADLRPIIQLDGGRHSTVDINELYRRVIIRNNRLKQWINLGAPDLIIQNEKRMLQESADALFDNARKKIPVISKDNRPLKSLAENLKGKQGRFRQNLLGKRVDYSGRSVIVVGPELRLHQVGLPKQMVVKLFEPFIVNLLVEEGITRNIKQAKKMIELYDDRIWKYAERVIKNHPVLLNRAPTLHRLSIQAFEPVITSGKAIRLHPLVTPAFNADFDGDQMAVHVPLSKRAKQEAWDLMLSSNNVLGPKDGKLVLSPSQDIILGLYYLTKTNGDAVGGMKIYKNIGKINKHLQLDKVAVHSVIALPLSAFEEKFTAEIAQGYKYFVTTVGRAILNDSLPKEMTYINQVNESGLKALSSKFLVKNSEKLAKAFEIMLDETPFKKNDISLLIETTYELYQEEISLVLDAFKDLGFEYSTQSGTSVAISDIIETTDRLNFIKEGEKLTSQLHAKYEQGFITDDQRYQHVLKVWANVKSKVEQQLKEELEAQPENPLFMMMDSGARGNISNFVQLAGMRGLMSKTAHEYAALKRQGIISRTTEEIPIKSSFRTGLSPFEYFLSTHGARKGLSDTATKTAESGYLTRRLVDAVQDVVIIEDNCHTTKGFTVETIFDTRTGAVIESLEDRLIGRYGAKDIKEGNEIKFKIADVLIDADLASEIANAGVESVEIRTSLTCASERGICKKCFGIDLATRQEVNIGEAVGIISAQSIGEPGTQLTMRTFHTGGVAGVSDITQGFNRLIELVDANRNPKSAAIIAKKDGVVESIVQVEQPTESLSMIKEFIVSVKSPKEVNTYKVTSSDYLRVKVGQKIEAGKKIIEGSIKLQELLQYAGPIPTQAYLIKEIQRLYRIQGITISDKYIEVIIRQMLSKVQIQEVGDSNFYTSEIISLDRLKITNAELFAKGKNPAFGKQVIIGVKPLPLKSESFLSAASYQRTADALVNAAIGKKIDELYGVKENLIVGKRIPVGTGYHTPSGKYDIFQNIEAAEALEAELLLKEEMYADIDTSSINDEIRVINKDTK